MRKVFAEPQMARVLAVMLILAALAPITAHAQAIGGSDVAGMFQNIVTYLQGNLMTALATLAVIVVGITMMALRFSLMSIGLVIGGIAIAFSATSIVQTIRGG